MKIGMLTLHREINKGSVVQAYCLQQCLKQHFPDSTVELIDFKPETHDSLIPASVKLSLVQIPLGHWPNFYKRQKEKKNAVESFLFQKCKLSSGSCESRDLGKAREFVRRQNYDAIIVGSDIVWSLQKGSNFPAPPNIFHLPLMDDVKKGAVAVSTDQTDGELLENKELVEQCRKNFGDFDYISVRDKYSKEILKRIGLAESSIRYFPDPTIVHGIDDLIDSPPVSWSSKVAAVEIADPFLKRKVAKQLREEGYKVVNLLGPTIYNQISPPKGLSVQERIGIYQELDLLVTNRFHGSIFTLKTSETPLIYVEQATKYPDKKSKVRDLYSRLGIEEQILRYHPENGLPSRFVADYLDRWKNNTTKVSEEIDNLKNEGRASLEKIRKSIS